MKKLVFILFSCLVNYTLVHAAYPQISLWQEGMGAASYTVDFRWTDAYVPSSENKYLRYQVQNGTLNTSSPYYAVPTNGGLTFTMESSQHVITKIIFTFTSDSYVCSDWSGRPTSSSMSGTKTMTISDINAKSVTLMPNANVRIASVAVYYTNDYISVSGADLVSGSVSFPATAVESNSSKSINVSASNMGSNKVFLSVSGDDASMFSLSPAELTPTAGVVAETPITVTYTPTSNGSHEAILTIWPSTDITLYKFIRLTGTATADCSNCFEVVY